MKLRYMIILFLITAFCVYAKGQVESIEVLLVDDRENDTDINILGGEYFLFSNSINDKKGITIANLDLDSKPGANGSGNCVHFNFKLDTSIMSPFAGFGFHLNEERTTVDLGAFQGIRFFARGSGKVHLRLSTESSRKTFNDYWYPIDIKPFWTLYEVPFTDLKAPVWGPQYQFKSSEIFNVMVANADNESPVVDFFMDDIAFFKLKKGSEGGATIASTGKQTDKTGNKTTSSDKGSGLSQKKLDEVTGKRIAVVGLESQNMDPKITAVLVDFIINAFVNSGSVKVVDRGSIEKVLKEQAFQMQDFVDNTKVTEIGKLLGAEFVVTGNLNKIDDTMYLSIRLVSVKTAEIIGSSVTSAKEKGDYVGLCNDAVKKLFM